MNKLLAMGAAALGLCAGTAQAAPIIKYTPGFAGITVPAGTTVFQNFDGPASGTSIGTNTYVYSSSQGMLASQPAFGSTGNYAAVENPSGTLPGSSYTVSFAPTTLFAFVIGSLDTYNTLTLTFSDGSSPLVLNGSQIIGDAVASDATGSPTSSATNGVVAYYAVGNQLINGATFQSSRNAFEFDNLAAAPEPAAWAMIILGFGLMGGVLRRRPTTKVKFA